MLSSCICTIIAQLSSSVNHWRDLLSGSLQKKKNHRFFSINHKSRAFGGGRKPRKQVKEIELLINKGTREDQSEDGAFKEKSELMRTWKGKGVKGIQQGLQFLKLGCF